MRVSKRLMILGENRGGQRRRMIFFSPANSFFPFCTLTTASRMAFRANRVGGDVLCTVWLADLFFNASIESIRVHLFLLGVG